MTFGNAHHPGEVLHKLARTSATGEFIAASDGVEVHVHLQNGRLAWGTTTTDRFVFRRFLLERCRVDPDALRACVDECRRTRRPVGETLVEWALLTREQLRDGLRLQLETALDALGGCERSQTLFLPRTSGYSEYDSELTFGLASFDLSASTTRQGPCDDSERLLARLEEALPDLEWAELTERRAIRARRGTTETPAGLASRLVPAVEHTGGDFVAVRSSAGTLLGVALPAERWLWCGLHAESTYGAALSALFGLLEHAREPASPPPLRDDLHEEGEAVDEGSGIRDLLRRAREVVCVVLLENGRVQWVAGRQGADLGRMAALAAVRQKVLDADVFTAHAQQVEAPLDSYVFHSCAVGDDGWWWFGTSLPGGVRSAWLALPRFVSQGLGWALLTSLARMVPAAEGDR